MPDDNENPIDGTEARVSAFGLFGPSNKEFSDLDRAVAIKTAVFEERLKVLEKQNDLDCKRINKLEVDVAKLQASLSALARMLEQHGMSNHGVNITIDANATDQQLNVGQTGGEAKKT